MTKEEALKKLKKLEGMLRATPNEAKNARLLIERLIKKYNISPQEVNPEKKWHKYKLHRLKKYGIHLAKWARIKATTVPGQPDFIRIYADSDEYRMFHELIDEIKHQFNKHIRIFEKEVISYFRNTGYEACNLPKSTINKVKNDKLKSFMSGYMSTNYPFDPMMCFICFEGTLQEYVRSSKHAYQCDSCGAMFGISKYQGYREHMDAKIRGVNTTTKAVKQSRMAITQK